MRRGCAGEDAGTGCRHGSWPRGLGSCSAVDRSRAVESTARGVCGGCGPPACGPPTPRRRSGTQPRPRLGSLRGGLLLWGRSGRSLQTLR